MRRRAFVLFVPFPFPLPLGKSLPTADGANVLASSPLQPEKGQLNCIKFNNFRCPKQLRNVCQPAKRRPQDIRLAWGRGTKDEGRNPGSALASGLCREQTCEHGLNRLCGRPHAASTTNNTCLWFFVSKNFTTARTKQSCDRAHSQCVCVYVEMCVANSGGAKSFRSQLIFPVKCTDDNKEPQIKKRKCRRLANCDGRHI